MGDEGLPRVGGRETQGESSEQQRRRVARPAAQDSTMSNTSSNKPAGGPPPQQQRPAASPAAARGPVGTQVRFPEDRIGSRLQVASLVSLGVNLVVMYGGAAMAKQEFAAPSRVSQVEIRAVKTAPVKLAETKTPVPVATPAPVATPEPPKQVAQERPRPERVVRRERPRPVERKPVQVAQVKPPRPRPVERDITPTPPPPDVKPPEETTPPAPDNVTPDRGEQNPTVARGKSNPNETSPTANETPQARLGTGAPDITDRTIARNPNTAGPAAGTEGLSGPAGRRSVTVAQGERQGQQDLTNAGQFTDPNSSLARATGAPALRSGTADGAVNPGTGGLTARTDVSGSGGATVASPTISAARGTVGLPGGPAGPRNRVLTASERSASVASTDFTIEQGGGIRAGTPIPRQGAAGGQLGVETGSVAPRFAGTGSGAGTGNAGIAAGTFRPSAGPITGGAGPVGPRGRAPMGYSGGSYRALGGPGGTADGSPGGIIGGSGRPGQGSIARSTGFGGGSGSDGVGTRLGVKDGTPGAAAGVATIGRPGSGRGPLGDGGDGGEGAAAGPRGRRIALGSGGGGLREGQPGSPGSPDGVIGGSGTRPGGNGTVARRGSGGGGAGDITTSLGTKEGTVGGGGGAGTPGRKDVDAKEGKVEIKQPEIVGKRLKVQDIKVKRQVKPSIPESLQGTPGLAASVKVIFRVRKNGSFSVSITSSGNAQVDQIVRSAMEQWQFEPAYEDGNPIDSAYEVRIDIKNG
jgi:hypothetical protein